MDKYVHEECAKCSLSWTLQCAIQFYILSGQHFILFLLGGNREVQSQRRSDRHWRSESHVPAVELMDLLPKAPHNHRLHACDVCCQQDGLWLVSQQPSVIQGYQKGILTPNFMEFTRMYESLVGQSLIGDTLQWIVCVKIFMFCTCCRVSTTSPWTALITTATSCSSA